MRTSGWVTLGAVVLLGVSLSAQEKPTESFVKLMQSAGSGMRSIGQGVEAKDYDAIASEAAALQGVFVEVGAFWRERDNNEDALAACGATYQAAAAIEAAAKAHDDEAIATSMQAMGGGCQSCHAAHREGPRGGPYTIK